MNRAITKSITSLAKKGNAPLTCRFLNVNMNNNNNNNNDKFKLQCASVRELHNHHYNSHTNNNHCPRTYSTLPPVADLCDTYIGDNKDMDTSEARFLPPDSVPLRDFGKLQSFAGFVETVEVVDSNVPVRSVLSEAGDGRVLVVNVKESGRYKFAVLGDNVAQLAADNNWAGIVINGCVRDTNELRRMDIGIKAVGVNPLKTHKIDYDEAGLQACKDLDLDIGGVQVKPRMYLAADADGVIISDKKLV